MSMLLLKLGCYTKLLTKITSVKGAIQIIYVPPLRSLIETIYLEAEFQFNSVILYFKLLQRKIIKYKYVFIYSGNDLILLDLGFKYCLFYSLS